MFFRKGGGAVKVDRVVRGIDSAEPRHLTIPRSAFGPGLESAVRLGSVVPSGGHYLLQYLFFRIKFVTFL